jgi:maltoporin
VPETAARILRRLDAEGLLGRHLFVVGTHALFAYEAASGVLFDAGLTATEDVDLLWDVRRKLSLAFNAKDLSALPLERVKAAKLERNGISYAPADGFSVGIIHTQDHFFDGFNMFALQYGKGLGRNLNPSGLPPAQANASNVDEASAFRLTENALVVPTEDWSVMGTFIWEERDAKRFDGSAQTWLSAGCVPTAILPITSAWARKWARTTSTTKPRAAPTVC